MPAEAAALAAAGADERELAGVLEPALVEAMRAEGVFAALVPAALGGGEVEPRELVAIVESLAAADGSAGWCAGVGATAGLASAYLPEGEAAGLFGRPPAIAAGVFAPRGKLSAGDGSGTRRLSGRWPLASGISHAEVVGLGCIDPERGPLYVVVPRADVEVIETWDPLGLRATASHDVTTDVVVPESRIVDLAGGTPVADGPLYAFPLFGLLALSVSAVCTGLAAGALAGVREAATARKPLGSSRSLAERGTTQEAVAAAEGSLRAARAGVDAAIVAAWDAAQGAGPLSVEHRVDLRIAATHAARYLGRRRRPRPPPQRLRRPQPRGRRAPPPRRPHRRPAHDRGPGDAGADRPGAAWRGRRPPAALGNSGEILRFAE